MGLFSAIKSGLAKTRDALLGELLRTRRSKNSKSISSRLMSASKQRSS